jgi:hypothetical protein
VSALQHHGALLFLLMRQVLDLAAGVMVNYLEDQGHKVALMLRTGGSHCVGLLTTHITPQCRIVHQTTAQLVQGQQSPFTRILCCAHNRADGKRQQSTFSCFGCQ